MKKLKTWHYGLTCFCIKCAEEPIVEFLMSTNVSGFQYEVEPRIQLPYT